MPALPLRAVLVGMLVYAEHNQSNPDQPDHNPINPINPVPFTSVHLADRFLAAAYRDEP